MSNQAGQQTKRRIHEIVEHQLQDNASGIALTDCVRALSYTALYQAACELKLVFLQAGLRPGDRLLLVGENAIVQIAAVFAASMLDATAVIVNARLTASEVDAIRLHSQPRFAFYTIESSPDAEAHAQRRGATEYEVDGVGRFALDQADEQVFAEPIHDAASDQVAVMIYTTGTTGSPKGVMLTHANLLFSCSTSSRSRFTTAQDSIYAALPISHVYGLTSVVLAGLWAGAKVMLVARFKAAEAAQALSDGITIFQAVPAMYSQLLTLHETVAAIKAPALRFIYIGGAPLDATLKAKVEAMMGLSMHNGYGMTESSPTISQIPFGSKREDTSVGYLIPGLESRIVDEQGVDVALGSVGELWVRGPNVMKGYFREPALTAETLTADGWLKTGDLARQDPDGALYLVGRIKDLIIRSGFNVYPSEVEAVANTYPGIHQSAVLGKPVDSNEEIIAFVQVDDAGAFDTDALSKYMAQKLVAYKRPQRIVAMESLPQAPSGKILKNSLKALL